MKSCSRIFAFVSAFVIMLFAMLTLNAAAAETNEKTESSTFIDLQLENIAEQMGQKAAQKMFLQTITVAQGAGSAVKEVTIPIVAEPKEQAVEFSIPSLVSFVVVAILLICLVFAVIRQKAMQAKGVYVEARNGERKHKTAARRFSLD